MLNIEENLSLAKSNSDLVITVEKHDGIHDMSVSLVGVDDGTRKFKIQERDFDALKYVSGNMLKRMTQEICSKTNHEHNDIGISFYCNTFDTHVMIGMKFDAVTTSPTVIIDGDIVDVLEMTKSIERGDAPVNFTYNDIVNFFRSNVTLH